MQTAFPLMKLPPVLPDVSLLRRTTSPRSEMERAPSRYTTEIIVAGDRTGWQRVTSGIGAIGVALLVPVAILAVGIPIAIAVSALIEAAGWLMSAAFR